MKATKVSRDRAGGHESEDSLKKAAKLDPIKKSGKEKHSLYNQDDEDLELYILKKQKSTLDYYDDGEDTEDDDWEEGDEEWGDEGIDDPYDDEPDDEEGEK